MEDICYGRNYGLCNKEAPMTWQDKTFCHEHYYEIYYGKLIRRFMDIAKEKGVFGKLDDIKEIYLHNRLLDCLKEAGYTGIE